MKSEASYTVISESFIIQVDVGDIRFIYKRSFGGYFVHIDNDFVGSLLGGFFFMKIMVCFVVSRFYTNLRTFESQYRVVFPTNIIDNLDLTYHGYS